MSKIYEEMRKVADGSDEPGTTNKTLLRFVVTGLVEVNDKLRKMEEANSESNARVQVINRTIETLNELVSECKVNITETRKLMNQTNESVKQMEMGMTMKLGKYLEDHPKSAIVVLMLLIIVALHAIGVEFSIGEVYNRIKDFIGLLF